MNHVHQLPFHLSFKYGTMSVEAIGLRMPRPAIDAFALTDINCTAWRFPFIRADQKARNFTGNWVLISAMAADQLLCPVLAKIRKDSTNSMATFSDQFLVHKSLLKNAPGFLQHSLLPPYHLSRSENLCPFGKRIHRCTPASLNRLVPPLVQVQKTNSYSCSPWIFNLKLSQTPTSTFASMDLNTLLSKLPSKASWSLRFASTAMPTW